MARSSRRRGAKIPGVSRNTSWACTSMAMPRSSVRVVCTLGVTIATLLPTSALISVDFPALGAPISAMKPQRVPISALAASSGIGAIRLYAFALEHGGGSGLLGAALGAAKPLGRLAVRQRHRDPEFRIVMRPGAGNLAVGRCRQAARLGPFLQDGLGIAERPHRRPQPLAPQLLHDLGRGVMT